MLYLCLLTVLGRALAEFVISVPSECQIEIPQYFNLTDLPLVKNVGGDCVMFLSDLEEVYARQFCRAWKAEYSEFFLSRSDSDNATRHSLPVCLLSRETPIQALLISGGVDQSSEVYVPSKDQHCQLPDLPDDKERHTLEKMMVCGGKEYWDLSKPSHHHTATSCLTLTNAGWEVTTTLLEKRFGHVSWDSPSGIILIGGYGSPNTTEKILQDGTSSYSFDLKYSTRGSCAINLGNSVILTGGHWSDFNTKVSQYNEAGWVRDLPDLLQERQAHGCSYFYNNEGIQTLLVTGGTDGGARLSSTELLVGTASAWVNTEELPSSRHSLRGANIDNRVFMTGGEYWSGGNRAYADILEFKPPTDPTNPMTGQWKLVANMTKVRGDHAISVIDYSEVAQFCNEE